MAGTGIDFAWGGDVAMTVDRMPHAGRFGNAWYLTGCNGSGVALMPWLGSRLASAIGGNSAFPAFAELRHRPVPLDRFRSRWLPLVGRWYAHADRAT
jgi:glycine/D-amino acid oxidase-like deaminating enzyme